MPRSIAQWSTLFVAVFFGLLLPIYRYGTYLLTNRDFVYDARVWVSVGESVLQGQALYADIADNKPPVWEGIAILASATPVPYLVLLLVVGMSSALLVVLVVQLAERFVSEKAAVLAAVLIGFGLLQATNGFINNKTLALACLLGGVLSRREVTAGSAYAFAALIAQQIVLATPIIIWWEWKRETNFRILSLVVLGIFGLSYMVVGLIWGVDALSAGLRQTVFLAGDYATGASQFETNGSPLTHTTLYIELLNTRLRLFTPVIVLAGIGLARLLSHSDDAPHEAWLAFGLTATLTLPLAVRLYRHYFLLPLVGAVLLATYGADWFFPTRYQDEQ